LNFPITALLQIASIDAPAQAVECTTIIALASRVPREKFKKEIANQNEGWSRFIALSADIISPTETSSIVESRICASHRKDVY